MTGSAIRLEPRLTGEYTISAANAHMSNTSLLTATFDGSSGPDRLVWTMDVPEAGTVNGVTEVRLRVKTDDVDKNTLMLGAVLVDQAEDAFPCFDTGSIGVLDQQVIRKDSVNRGAGAEPYDLVTWKQVERNRKIVAFGAMDLRNPEAGYMPSTAVKREESIAAGTWYDYTLYLQPAYYTVAAGHRLELYIVPFCGFSDDAAVYDSFSPAELESMGLQPEELVPVTRDYSFTVDNEASFAVIPMVLK